MRPTCFYHYFTQSFRFAFIAGSVCGLYSAAGSARERMGDEELSRVALIPLRSLTDPAAVVPPFALAHARLRYRDFSSIHCPNQVDTKKGAVLADDPFIEGSFIPMPGIYPFIGFRIFPFQSRKSF